MTGDFGAAVARMRAAMAGEDPWAASEGTSADLQAKRKMGLAAYTAAMERRGMSRGRARIMASALPLFEGLADLDDDF